MYRPPPTIFRGRCVLWSPSPKTRLLKQMHLEGETQTLVQGVMVIKHTAQVVKCPTSLCLREGEKNIQPLYVKLDRSSP